MEAVIKKNKSNDSLIEDYMNSITKKYESLMPIITKKTVKINDEKISIPTINTYHEMTKYNYTLNQLKGFAKHYKLKISGNKNELIPRVYSYLYFSSYIIKIQKIFRGFWYL